MSDIRVSRVHHGKFAAHALFRLEPKFRSAAPIQESRNATAQRVKDLIDGGLYCPPIALLALEVDGPVTSSSIEAGRAFRYLGPTYIRVDESSFPTASQMLECDASGLGIVLHSKGVGTPILECEVREPSMNLGWALFCERVWSAASPVSPN